MKRSLAIVLLALSTPALADTFTGLSLRIPNRTAPPGGSVQLEVQVTEPKPIIIGFASVCPGLSLQGLTLPGTPDAGAAAVIRGTDVDLNVISPTGSLGMSTQVPAVVATFAVPPSMPVGTTAPLQLDPATSWWLDPTGQPYPLEIRQGTFTAGGTVSITDVVPGGGFLPAGSVVTLTGLGFQPGLIAEIDTFNLASITWVSANRVDLVTATAGQLDGQRVRVINPDATRAQYYSYLRAASLGRSARPLLQQTEPVYPVRPLSGGSFTAPAAGKFLGLALQNPGAATATVSVQLLSAGSVVASGSFALPPRTELLREASELLTGVIPLPGNVLQVTSGAPVQMLGLQGDEAAGSVTPLLPANPVP